MTFNPSALSLPLYCVFQSLHRSVLCLRHLLKPLKVRLGVQGQEVHLILDTAEELRHALQHGDATRSRSATREAEFILYAIIITLITEHTYCLVLSASLIDLLLQPVVFSLEGGEALHSRFPHARQRPHVATEKSSHLGLHLLHLREEKYDHYPNKHVCTLRPCVHPPTRPATMRKREKEDYIKCLLHQIRGSNQFCGRPALKSYHHLLTNQN